MSSDINDSEVQPESASAARPVAPAAPAAIAPSRSPWNAALLRALRQPSFVVVTVVLLVAALGLNAAVTTMKLHFKKEPVPLKHELGTVPSRFGSWVQVTPDQALDKEMQDVLGTDKYIFRNYVDERLTHAGIADEFKAAKDERARNELLAKVRRQDPAALVNLSVTYYTGMVDTVAHVPDRCVTADGYEPSSYLTPSWPIAAGLPAAEKPGGKDDIAVRFINFEDQTGTSNVPRNIAYFFHSNGKFISDPLGVRNELANLFEKRGYYAKIECMTTIPEAADAKESKSAKVLTDFLTSALPEIYRCMPDWNQASVPAAAAPAPVAAAPAAGK